MPAPATAIRARTALLCALASGALVAAGCGGEVDVTDKRDEAAANLFNERCSGCHSLEAANAYGSKPENLIEAGERTNGPNFDVREAESDDVLFAIRNGGFSGAIMPANIVVGEEAEQLAEFVAEYAGG